MREESKGATLAEQELIVSPGVLSALEKSLGSSSGHATAALVTYFAATITGEETVVEGIGLNLSKALLAGLEYHWERPFTANEVVRVKVTVDDVYTKGSNQFGVISAAFTDAEGVLVQRQLVTFIEKGNA